MNIVEAVLAGLLQGAEFKFPLSEEPELRFDFPVTDVPQVYAYYDRKHQPKKEVSPHGFVYWGVLAFLTTDQFEVGSGFGSGTTVKWRIGAEGGARRPAAWEWLFYGLRGNGDDVLKKYFGALMMHILIEEIAGRLPLLAANEGIEMTRAMRSSVADLREKYPNPRPALIQELYLWSRRRKLKKMEALREKKRRDNAPIRL